MLGVIGEVFADEGGDEVIAVVVALLPAQGQRKVAGGANPFERCRVQLLGQKLIGGALIDQQGNGLRSRLDQAGGIVIGPCLAMVAQIGFETALPPAAGHRVTDRREGGNGPVAPRFPEGADQRAVPTHRMAGDGADIGDR